jgi:hypothetical protein
MPESDVELGRHPAHDSNVVGRPMGMISVFAERVVDAPAPTVYGYLADMREHHPRFLPPAFSASKSKPEAWAWARSPVSR